MATVTTLQALAQRRLRDLGSHGEPLSARQAALRAEGLVSYETLRLIVKGEHSGRISPQVAEGLSLALQVPLEQIYAAARKRAPQGPFMLPPEADSLDPKERKAVLSVVDAILSAHEGDGLAADQHSHVLAARPTPKRGKPRGR